MSVPGLSALVLVCKSSALQNLNLTVLLNLSPPNIPILNPSVASFQIKHPPWTYSPTFPETCLVECEIRNGKTSQAHLFFPSQVQHNSPTVY